MYRNNLPPHGRVEKPLPGLFGKPPPGRAGVNDGKINPPPPVMPDLPQTAPASTTNAQCILFDFRGCETGDVEFPVRRDRTRNPLRTGYPEVLARRMDLRQAHFRRFRLMIYVAHSPHNFHIKQLTHDRIQCYI